MREVPPDDPGHRAWVERLRALARSDADELVPRPGFGVFGVAGRPDGWLASAESVDGELSSVELAYGDPVDPDGPHVRVRSVLRRDGARGPERTLSDELVDEHNRMVDHAGVDDPEPPGPPVTGPVVFDVDGETCEGRLRRHGPLWVARLHRPGVAVTVIGRGVEPVPALAVVADLAPHQARRGDTLATLARVNAERGEPELPPAAGPDVHRALVDHVLRDHETDHAARRAGTVPRRTAGKRGLWRPLWRRAVAFQRELALGGDPDADVTSMVNHVTHLVDRAPWFSDPVLRATAVDEIVLHTVGERVPSEPAQRAWERWWSGPDRRGPDEEWLAAWARWRDGP